MRDIEFDEPVDLLAGDSTRRVSTAGQAATWLLQKWPAKPGPRHRAARQALVALLEGRGTPTEARQAFEHAADEAEIRIGGIHAKNPIAMFMARNHGSAIGVKVPRPRKR